MPDLKFIVYNIKGLPVGGNSLRNVKTIARQIVADGYQVVCLNEVLSETVREEVANIFEQAGYHLIRKSGVDYGAVQDSGLFLASKFPIIYKNFEEYTDWKVSVYFDQFANKGILGALLDLSSLNNNQEELYLYAFITHMHSEPDHPDIRTKQLRQAKRFISSMIRLHQGYPSQTNSTIAGLSKIALAATGTAAGCYLGMDYDDWIAIHKTHIDETETFQIIKGWDTNDNTPLAYGETVHFRSHKGTYLDVDKNYYLAADEYSLAHTEVAKYGFFRILNANNEADTEPIHDGDQVVLKDYADKYVYCYHKSGKYWGCGGGSNSQKITFEIKLQQVFQPSKIVPLNKSNAIYAGDFNLKADSSEYANMINTLGQPQDLWQVKRPGEPGFTYATQHLDQRIDYILSFPHLPSNNIEKLMGLQCKEISTLPWQESDHLPISAVFSFPNS